MTRSGIRRLGAGAIGAALVIAAVVGGAALRSGSADLAARPAGERPKLLLLSALPIAFPEGFSLDADASPVRTALDKRYRLRPISAADEQSLRGHKLLLMAQPRAQPADVLVQLDSWVRSGGHVLLLADPMLERPSERALGDVLRPPLAFADTGILGHWGLRLDAPESRGPVTLAAGDSDLRTLSPGMLVSTSGACRVEASRLVARCTIGRGRAVVVADADFLDTPQGASGNDSDGTAFLLGELASLEK